LASFGIEKDYNDPFAPFLERFVISVARWVRRKTYRKRITRKNLEDVTAVDLKDKVEHLTHCTTVVTWLSTSKPQKVTQSLTLWLKRDSIQPKTF